MLCSYDNTLISLAMEKTVVSWSMAETIYNGLLMTTSQPHLYCDLKCVCPVGLALGQQVVTGAMEVIHAAIKSLVVGVPPGSTEARAGSVCA